MKIARVGILSLFVAMIANVPHSWTADVESGRKLARKCVVCHGRFGIGNDPEVPHLAGQSAFYIEKSLIDFQTGKRQDRRMTLMAKPLTNEQIKDLAAWFESIKIMIVEQDR